MPRGINMDLVTPGHLTAGALGTITLTVWGQVNNEMLATGGGIALGVALGIVGVWQRLSDSRVASLQKRLAETDTELDRLREERGKHVEELAELRARLAAVPSQEIVTPEHTEPRP